MHSLHAVAGGSLLVAALIAACGSDGSNGTSSPPPEGTAQPGNPPPFTPAEDGSVVEIASLAIEPADSVVTFTSGLPAPTVQLTAKANGAFAVPASFSVDRGELGSVGLGSGLFTASGSAGGTATVTASYMGKTATATIKVKLVIKENGLVTGDAGAGSGGYGGVGGEGSGGPVSNATIDVLKGPKTMPVGLSLLYPYDKTVWPRGILAPLLQWRPGAAPSDFDAVYIKLSEAAFEYEGFFAKTATPFVHHPIPQTAWKQLLASNAGEDVKVSLVFAKGNAAYGPLEATWKIASAPLKGIVYYNSYGTRLVNNGVTGAATLAIKGSATEPVVVAGSNGCRVCHSVSANGAALITQRGDAGQRKFSAYDLKTSAETLITPEGASAPFAWPALFPDGSFFLGDSSAAPGSTSTPNGLFTVPTGSTGSPAAIASNWPAGFRAAFPAFSPDGKRLAFTMYAGATGADQKSLGHMTFDVATKAFGPIQKLYTPATGAALYPSFLPTNDAVVFERETVYNGRDYGGTRSQADVAPPDPRADLGARAELWWLDLKSGKAHPLDALNGKTGGTRYIPTGPNGHDDDTTLNYEPTVNPVPSGGYAWVVFTSRRLYGNVATINPYYSNPSFYDLGNNVTPKKLWVAAIDLDAPPGTDPSHPAFYLPAQELLAGNSRGYWVVDPCKGDGTSCETGDECCGGYCRPGNDGALVCSAAVPTCAQEFEKCTTSADCCNSSVLQCINGRCAASGPK